MRKKPKLTTGVAVVIVVSLACNSSGLPITETPQQPLLTPTPLEGEPGSISEVVIYSDPDIPLISHYEFVTSDENIIESVDLLGSKADGDVTVEGAQLRFVGDSRPWTLQFDEMVRVIDVQTPDGAAYRIEFESGTTAKVEFLNENGQTGTEHVELEEDVKALLDIIRNSAGTSQKSHAVFSAAFELEPAYRDTSDPPPPQYEYALTASQTFSLFFTINGEMIDRFGVRGIKAEVRDCEGVACLSSSVEYWPDGITLETVHIGQVPVDENPPAALTGACEEKGKTERIGLGIVGIGAGIVGAFHANVPMVVAGATFTSLAMGGASFVSDTLGYTCTELAQWQVAKREFGDLVSNVTVCVSHPHIEFDSPCKTVHTNPFPVRKSDFGDYLVFDRSGGWSVTFDGICSSIVDFSELSPCGEDDDSSGGEEAGGDTPTDGGSGITNPIVQVEADSKETLKGSDPPQIWIAHLKLIADFKADAPTLSVSIAGDFARSAPWECRNPNDSTELWDTAELFFTDSYSAEFTTQLGPEGDFSSKYFPIGSTHVALTQPFTDENCIERNDPSVWGVWSTSWTNPAKGTISGYVTPDGWFDISTDWSVGGWGPITGTWIGAGTVQEP